MVVVTQPGCQYTIRIKGRLGPTALSAFPTLESEVRGGETVLTGALEDRSELERLAQRYGERFRRMWTYYLSCCAGAFRARHLQLWQIVLSKEGLAGGYRRTGS